jgi:membrane-associated progesterone receptor component
LGDQRPRLTGTVFDVSAKRDTYGSGGSYNIFAGKDASRALGKSTLKAEDAVADYSTLNEQERKTLDEWHSFFGFVARVSP